MAEIFDFNGKKREGRGGNGGDGTEPPNLPVSEDLVEALTDMLEQAKLGHLTSLCGVIEWATGDIGGVDLGFPDDPWRFWAALQHNSLEYREFYLTSPFELE